MGHIDQSAERNRRLGEAMHAMFADERHLRKEFSRRIGSRTFRLLRRIGQEDNTNFVMQLSGERLNTVRTSKPFPFSLPGRDADFSLQLEVDHMTQAPLLRMIPPRTFYGVGAKLSRVDEHGKRSQTLKLDMEEFVNGTVIHNEVAGYSRQAVGDYSMRTAKFINLLDFTEGLLEGRLPNDVSEETLIFSAGARLLRGSTPELEA